MLNFYAGAKALPRFKEKFSRKLNEENEVSELEYSYQLSSPRHQISVSYTLSPGEKLYELNQSVIVKNEQGQRLYSDDYKLGIDKLCSFFPLSHEVDSYVYNSKYVDITRTELEQGMIPKVFRNRIDTETAKKLFSFSDPAALVESVDPMSLDGRTIENLTFINEKMEVLIANIQRIPPIERLNPFSEKVETLRGARIKVGPIRARFYLSQDNQYLFSSFTDVNKYFSETLPKTQWLKEDFGRQSESKPVVVGLASKDLIAGQLRLRLEGFGGLPKLFNTQSYMQIEEVKSSVEKQNWIMNVNIQPPRVDAVSWNAPADAEDQRYLKFTRYIQADPVQNLVNRVRSRIRGLNRIQASVIIIEEIRKVIKYDHDALGGLVSIRPVEEVMADKKGVCQQFAAVFVAVDRSLGITARIV